MSRKPSVQDAMHEPPFRRRPGRYWHLATLTVAAVALVLQLALVFRVIRLASLVGITVTGIVAAVALPPSPSYSTLNLLCDRLLHIAVPALTFIGWLAFGPRGKIRRDDLLPSLIWPVLWLAATLALGPFVGWYPYPFINVDQIGYGRTLVNCAVIAVLFFALAATARWADKRLPTRALGHDTISS